MKHSDYLKKKKTRETRKKIISVISAIVVFITTYALVLPAITLDVSKASQEPGIAYEQMQFKATAAAASVTAADSTVEEAQVEEPAAEEPEEEPAEEIKEEEPAETPEEEASAVSAEEEEEEEPAEEAPAEPEQEEAPAQEAPEAQEDKGQADSADEKSSESAPAEAEAADTQKAAEDTAVDQSGTDTAEAAAAATTEAAPEFKVPELDALDFDEILTGKTNFYYYHVEDAEEAEEISSDSIDDWKKVNSDTVLAPEDFVRVYLSYEIPAGALNETNAVARYTLPAGLELSDKQIKAINKYENGIAASKSGSERDKYLGAEAIEGSRTPDEKADDEYISATVKLKKTDNDRQELVFTFIPYTVEKNQISYDEKGEVKSKGKEVRGFFTFDLKPSQIDFDNTNIETVEKEDGTTEEIQYSEAKVVFADEDSNWIERALTLAAPVEKEEAQEPKTLTSEGPDYTVTVSYTDDAQIPDNATLEVSEIGKGTPEYAAYLDQAKGAVNDETKSVNEARFFDITIVADGQKVEPKAPVNVQINFTGIEQTNTDDTQLLHYKDDKDVEVMDQAEFSKSEEKAVDTVQFETEGFSVYGIVGTETITVDYLTDEGSTYEITIDLSDVTNIPNDSYIDIRELTGDEYDRYLSATAEALGTNVDSIARTKLFDIGIKSGEDEIEPNGKVSVDFKLKKELFGDAAVVHFGEDTEVLDTTTEGNVVSFETVGFSVYAIVPYDGIPQPARVTFEFEDPNNADFTFIDRAGNPQTTQIIKNGEDLQDVGLPTIPEGETFGGWFIYDGDEIVEAVSFESAISVAYGEDGAGSTVSASSITIDPADLGEDGTYHVKVKAFFGEVVYLTFYEDAGGNNILNKIQIAKGSNYDISNVTVNAPESELLFGGWASTAGENDDDREVISPTALTNIQNDRPFYPTFKSGHWLTFYAGATGSGATYTAPAFVIAGGTAAGAQPSNPTWKGYAFQYWTETNLYTGEDGAYVQPSTAPARFNFNSEINESKTLYAYWTPADTTYTVVFWQQDLSNSKNATDAQKTYSFAEQITEHGTSGTTVYASNYAGRYTGFSLNTNRSQTSVVVNADGTSIINIYFDRNLITMNFTRNYNTTTYTGLYGQTLAQNNYSWPSGYVWQYRDGNQTIQMSYLGQFVLPISGNTINFTSAGQAGKTFYFFLQNVDGSYPTTYSDRGYGTSTTGTFYLSEKYDGFEVVSYQRGNRGNGQTGTWTAGASGGSVNISNYTTLGVRYQRKHFTLKYLDSVDNTELSGISNQDVVYGASLSGYRPAASFTPVSQYPGKVWDGKWYKDQACTEEFDWSVTMPNADMVVYAGWEDVYYKVDVDPNGGVLTSSESTFTWLTYGQSIQRYDDVVRDYAEDPNGTYKYESFLRTVYTDRGYDPWDYTGYLRTAGYVSNDTSTTTTMTPYSGQGGSVSITYPYDSTRYKYEKGAYALIGWYEITFADGHYGDMNYKTGESLYTFGTGVTHDTYIQAKWRRVGEYHVDYKTDVYLMDEDGNISTSDSGIETTNVPTDSNSYADQSQSAIMRSPDSPIIVGTGADAKQYVFQGWYYNGQLYTPGEVFTVLSSIAEDKVIGTDPDTGEDIIQKTVNVYPVYQSVDDVPVDVTHIWWYSNWKDKDGNQISNLSVSTQLKDETNNELQPNEAIDILAIDDLVGDSTDFEGYTFKGWARVPVDVDVTADTFNANAYMYLYWDGENFHVDSETGTVVTEVAADENLPYHDMYAVWEINKYTVTITKTVVGTDADQHKGFTFAPVFTKYTGGSNFILAGQETTVTDEDTGTAYTYYTSKEFSEVPYGAALTLTENDEDEFDTTVKYTVTTNADGTNIDSPTAVESADGETYTIQGDITIAYTNSRNKQNVKIVKAGDNTTGASIEGAAFTLSETEYGTLTSDADGNVTDSEGNGIFPLDVGNTYALSETAAPQYFEGLTGDIHIAATASELTVTPTEADTANVSTSVDDDGVTVITITNIRKTVDLTVTKMVEGFDSDKSMEFAFTITGVGEEPNSVNLVGDTTSEQHSVTYEGVPYGSSITVAETANDDFDTEYSLNGADAVSGTSYSFTVNDEVVSGDSVTLLFTNKRNKQLIKVFKVETGTTKGLEGAVFSLTGPGGSDISYTGLETNEDGWLVLDGETTLVLPVNDSAYVLEETKAPDGYKKIGENTTFTVSPGTVAGATEDPDNPGTFIITVQNSAGTELPMTGGPGTFLYTLGGIALIMASALMYGFRMRRRERRLN